MGQTYTIEHNNSSINARRNVLYLAQHVSIELSFSSSHKFHVPSSLLSSLLPLCSQVLLLAFLHLRHNKDLDKRVQRKER